MTVREKFQKIVPTVLLGLFALWSQLGTSEEKTGIYIDVGQASVKRSLLALPSFVFFSSDRSDVRKIEMGQELFKTVANDLTASGYFTFIKPDAFPEDTSKLSLKPAPEDPKGFNFASWKAIDTEFLIRGGYRVAGSQISLEAFLYHVPQGKLIFGKTYQSANSGLRKMAHTFANDVIKSLTGNRGPYVTQIVASVQVPESTNKEIYVMDWDGFGLKKISDHKSVAISPSWSPDGKKVSYTAFAYHTKAKTRNADLFVYELYTGKRFLVSYRKGINSGSSFAPDGLNMLLTLSESGNPDIYRIGLDGKNLLRLTDGPRNSMNVEPVFNSSGTRIAFSSDRSGTPMIFTMSPTGADVKRITIAGKYNATPAFSPDGSKIAFSGMDNNSFNIYTINADGSGPIKKLTDVPGNPTKNEDPSWSPDGRHILFVSNRTGNSQIFMVNADGTNERRITFDKNNYFKPKWSPFLDN